ncbi:hypothetical protein Focb16_v004944 [Fusarium oxysporum f. sp. cubense]|uniref:Uncharacterized protein n=1 Tax=Fusarium oxysporum f. sp. cubense TaxID=61366 RepID=A0A559LM00_FUSOC|nr:hypothetical protein Focb16_v004944 [Fusarium oxysporum f. sp. cubense]
MRIRACRTKENVLQFLETYDVQHREHYKTKSLLLDKDQVIPAVTFHSKIVKPLAYRFVTWVQRHHDKLISPAQLSTTETGRILRAFYRYQLFCNLFGVDVQSRHGIGTDEERLEEYLDKFQPWEIEEILCINAFIEDKYSQVLDQVTWNFHPNNPKWDAEQTDPSTPEGAYNIEWFVLSSVFEARDHPALVELMSQYIISSNGDWFFEATDDLVQERWRGRFLSEGDQAQDYREPMPFEGDREGLPLLAWVILWKETSSNLYGVHIMEAFREWGSVMWDAGRLISSGAADTLTTEWERFCTVANGDLEDARDLI